MERTLILLKPDSVKRAVVGEVLTRFERAGLKIVGMKMINPDYDHYHEHYEGISGLKSRIGDEAFQATLDFMQESPVIAAVLEGIEAISLVRKMVGSTEPKSAQPGTIRGDYAHVSFDHANARGVSIPNLIHASGNQKEAKAEIAHWFSESELFDYTTVHDAYTQTQSKKK